MAVTRSSSEVLASRVRDELNRPEEDDLFSYPDDYYDALSQAHRWIRSKVVQHAPGLLASTQVFTTADGGESYDMGDHPLGELEVWEPPGPPNGLRLYPQLPESSIIGYYIEGTSVILTRAKVYTPGIYVRGTFQGTAGVDEDTEHSLPVYMEDMLVYRAAYVLARRPGSMADPNFFKAAANEEWSGDPREPSDMGILGTLKRMSANDGIQSAAGMYERPWYKFR